jgi:YegS/Rv2252/BmrU family lipid kinase
LNVTVPSKPERIYFVVNNKSGNACEQQVRAAAELCFPTPAEVQFFVRDRKGQSRRKATRQAIKDGFDTIVAVGGDGTVSRVADEIRAAQIEVPERKIQLGIIPTGSANLIARSLQLPLNVDESMKLLATAHAARRLDAMILNDRAYFSHISMGVYSQIAGDTTTWQKQRFGTAAYLWHLATALRRQQRWEFELQIDGVTTRLTASMIIACNVGAAGLGSLQWHEDVRPDDGRIDLCVIRSASIATYLKLIANAARGRQETTPNVKYLSAYDQVIIRSDRDLPVRADGKNVGTSTADLQLLRQAVPVIAAER